MDDTIKSARVRAQALSTEIHEFCKNEMPAGLLDRSRRHQVLSKEDYLCWMRLLQEKNWGTAHWPIEYGGQDWSPLERFIFEDQFARLGCPWVIPFGVKYVGPVIYKYGSREQKARFLPRIVNNEDFWAQGYSEPGAGSDLAGLRTTAVRDGDYYVVNGQKVWTTYAQWADWLFCLVRTGDSQTKAQNSISFLLIDMKSEGVTVKPIGTMDGYHHVNEVWLENVRVPVENLVGVAGQGWTYAKFLLKNERTAGATVGMVRHALDRLKLAAAERGELESPLTRNRIGQFELRFMALEQVAYQSVEAMMDGTENGGEASLIKIRSSELYQHVAEATVEALGIEGLPFDIEALHKGTEPPIGPNDAAGVLKDHFYNRAATIFGGASEIQRNIIAKAVLGL
ncbi:acyl-CoA dehydrogenase [Paraburkholderia steynii]|uniref:Acyl-CoA dehydrogenase n=1 Tax=Paraburkholderia steynii TaxID=1245441 RepID=A0A4R0XH02_9BURK|nr:acyl-CoA dehydrogenase [Paraburkholderia steynii]